MERMAFEGAGLISQVARERREGREREHREMLRQCVEDRLLTEAEARERGL